MQVAIITARGGSKRIPRKNIRPFLGKPMIAWSIEAALKAECFDKVLVSTDDQEIAEISRDYGAEVPFLRPSELAQDHTPVHEPLCHMLEWAAEAYGGVNAFSHIQPTAPGIDWDLLKKSMQILNESEFKAIWAMVHIPYPVYQIMVKSESGGLERLFSADKVMMRSQDMPPAYVDVGQFYSFDAAHFIQHGYALSNLVTSIEIPLEYAIDIDTEADWQRAERVFKTRLLGSVQ